MKNLINSLNEHFDLNQKKILADFFEYLKFKSVSTDPEFKMDVQACSDWVSNFLTTIGFATESWAVEGGHPCIFGERIINASNPTVLFYGHYDVQPVDPIELWKSDPFTPEIRDGEIYARGAEDNKGQSFYVMQAIKTLKELDKLPKNLNIKILIEGEEECGSKSLPKIIAEHSDKLKADYLYVVDFGFHSMDKPAITLGCRGIISMTLKLQGSKGDLHSGEHGGIAINPLHALVQLLSELRSPETGEILIPGFYDKISKLSEEDLKDLAIDLDPAFYEKMFAAKPLGGEKKYSPLESAWIRPTLEINGLSGGYAGPGFKTVIPAIATAKISCRLVPDQDPKEISELLIRFLKDRCPEGISLIVSDISTTGRPLRNSSKSELSRLTREVISKVTGYECVNILAGGSIPIASALVEASKAEPLFIGYGLPDDQIHAPNEHFGLNRIRLGHATIGAIIEELDNI